MPSLSNEELQTLFATLDKLTKDPGAWMGCISYAFELQRYVAMEILRRKM